MRSGWIWVCGVELEERMRHGNGVGVGVGVGVEGFGVNEMAGTSMEFLRVEMGLMAL